MIHKFVYYNYFESDVFASYLHEMSLQGYHFKGFGFGLKFEKGEPKDITYDAYVFNEQQEEDQGLNPNSEDFWVIVKRLDGNILTPINAGLFSIK